MSTYHDLAAYQEALTKYKQIPGKIINGIGFVLHKENYIPMEDFKAIETIPVYSPAPSDSADPTQIAPEIKVASSKQRSNHQIRKRK